MANIVNVCEKPRIKTPGWYLTQEEKNMAWTVLEKDGSRYGLLPKRLIKPKVRDYYSDWLQPIDWQWFVTFTTRYELTLPSARRLNERFYDRLKRLDRSGPALFWVAERFECKDGYHTHGLLRSQADFKAIIDAYQITSAAKRHGETFRVQLSAYDATRAAAKYCTDYILKRYGDYDFLLN